jgi:hypothetical protein
MKKNTRQALDQLWSLKREASAASQPDDSDFPPALVTRIAARWAARPSTSLIWERTASGALVLALIICGVTIWLRPEPPPSDAILSLFTARPAPDDGFPF